MNTDIHTDHISTTAQPMRPLFVLSLYRSGSSLLYTLLNQHSQICLLYEGDLPILDLFLWGQFRNGNWRQRWEFWNQGPSRHGVALESMPSQVSDIWEATRIVYQSVARRKGATIWGEKSPRWYESPLRTAEKFPDARFIFLWRDMHSVMGSVARAAETEPSFRKFVSRPATLLLGNERLKQACDALKARGRLVYEVNYEDLTANTSECMRHVCQFLDVPFEERMASLEGGDRSAIRPGEIHKLVRSDRIVGQRKQAEDLPAEVQAKIGRYICYWKQRSNGAWPKYPVELGKDTRSVSWLELWRDRTADEGRMLWDKAFTILLHQIRPLVYPKKYVRQPEVITSSVQP
jgi:Sulfotransferase family